MNPRFPKPFGNRKPFDKRKPFVHKGAQNGPKTSWEGVSDWYGRYMQLGGTVQREVVFPNTLRLLDPKKNGKYLDIACGEGTFSRDVANLKPVDVVGFDASPSLINKAKQTAPARATYIVKDATSFADAFPSSTFDGATCILAIQNIAEFANVFRDAVRVLKTGAALTIVMNHPAFRLPRQSGWGWDEARKLQYRRVDRYLSSYEVPIQTHPGAAPEVNTFSYHRPLSVYIGELVRFGFVVDAFEEWTSHKVSLPGARAKAENVARNEIPMFLAIRAVKK